MMDENKHVDCDQVAICELREKDDHADTYSQLEREKAKILAAITGWMARATALHTGVDAGKKAEIVALRDALKTEGGAALNS